MPEKRIQSLTKSRLESLLAAMKTRRVVLLGDMCLDVYWFADMTKSKLSRETPHYPLPVVEERMSGGAGGNVAVNLSRLCDNVVPVGVIGNDWRGKCLCEILEREGISLSGIVRSDDVTTNAYCKPHRRGYLGVDVEDPRIDFEMSVPLSSALEKKLLKALDTAVQNADVLCVSDQFEYGCVSDAVRRRVCELAEGGLLTVVDSRSRIGRFSHCILKPNEIECGRALAEFAPELALCAEDEASLVEMARALGKHADADVCLTLGDRGCCLVKGGAVSRVAAVPVTPPVDTVGAGDCFLSAFSLALAAGATDEEAAVIGSMASAIVVKKLNTTGSADRSELLALMEKEGVQ